MANWGVTIDDIKAEDELVATTWTDVQISDALSIGYQWALASLYRNWYEHYDDWDSNDAPGQIQHLVLLASLANLYKRLYYRDLLSESYADSFHRYQEQRTEQYKKIQRGELRVNETSDKLATLESIKYAPKGAYEVF